jgi:TP901 family phage tail tape measure protein
MSEVIAEYKVKVNSAVSELDAAAKAWQKVDDANTKANKTATDGFIKGSDGAKRLNAELQKQPKTLAELELKLSRLRELLRDDTEIGTKGFKQVTAEINKTQQAIDKANIGLKQTGGSVNNLGSKFKALGVQVLAALGVTGLVFGLVNAFKSAVGIATEFESQMSKVAAISGASASQIDALTRSAKELGSTTRYTATEVGQLQEEYARLGFTTSEILSATDATLSLATATGSTLAESAMVAGSTVRGFGLSASETTRVTDVMALSFSKSALSMDNFAESMKLVAPIAKAANIPVETTVALLGKLADSGLKGSLAGTSLKNLLSKLSDANSKLSKSLGFAVTDTESLFKALQKLKESNIDLTEATELTDERSKAAFITLLNGVDTIEDLKKALDGANGSAAEMARIIEDNLKGDVTRLTSAWEGLVLAMSDTKTARAATQLLTQLVDDLNVAVQKARGTFENNQFQEAISSAMKEGAEQAANTIKTIENLQSTEEGRIKSVSVNLKFIESQYDAEQKKISALTSEYNTLKTQTSNNARVRLREIRDELKGLDINSERLLAQIDTYAEYTEKIQESIDAKKGDNKEIDSNIRNIAFLKAEIERLKKAQDDASKSRLENIATSKELKVVEEELAILLGKETEAMKERRKELEKWEKVVKEAIDLDDTDFEKNIDKWTEAQIKAYRKLQEERAKVTATELSALDELVDVRIGLIEDESKRENTLAQKLEAIKGNSVYENELRFALAEEAENRITEIQENAQEKRNSESLDQWNQYSSAVQGAVAAISSFSMAVTDQELSNLELRLSQGEITREEYDKKRKVILEQQAEDQKAAALFQATIDGISAVVNAYSEGGPILAAVVGVAVAAEIAAIAAAPLPTFKEGGMVKEHGLLKGKSHAQGGIKVEAEGNEYFMPTKPTLKNYGLLEAMRKGVEEQYILKHYKGRFIDDAIFNGFADIGKSAELNNLTVNFKDHNLIHSDDKTRSTIRNGFKFLAKELKKENNSKRGGYRA